MPKDLQLCTDMATGVDSLGQYQFGDLVQIDTQTVGVIVQIQKESFQILNMHGKVVPMKPASLQKKRENKKACFRQRAKCYSVQGYCQMHRWATLWKTGGNQASV